MFQSSAEEWLDAIDRAVKIFSRRGKAYGFEGAEPLLIGKSGGLQEDRYRALYDQRNERRIYLLE